MKIEFKDLKKSFNENVILNSISGSFDPENQILYLEHLVPVSRF